MAYFSEEELQLFKQLPKQQAKSTSPKPKTQGRGGFLTSLIGEAGGAGGALGGAAIGTALLPGVGTVIGAGLGGLLGGTGGSAVEQKVRDDRIDVGKALREGAIEGVLSAGPIRGVKALNQLGKGALKKGATQVGEEVVEAGIRKGASDASTKLLGNAWGIRTGVKVGGKEIAPQQAKALQKFVIEEVGVPRTANATKVSERLFEFKENIGRNIADNITAINRPLRPSDKTQLIKEISTKINRIPGQSVDAPDVTRLIQQLNETPTVGELVNFRRAIDDQINYARNAATPDPVREQVFSNIRKSIDGFTSKLSPELKRQNQLYGKADEAYGLVSGAARSPRGIPIPGSFARVGGGLTQSAQSAAGQQLAGAVPRAVSEGANVSARGLIGRNLAAGGINSSLNAAEGMQSQLTPEQQLEEALMGMGSGEQMQQEQVAPQGLSQEDLQRAVLTDIQTTGGQNINDILKIYEIFSAQAEEPKMNATQQQRALTSASGLRSLDTLESTLQNDPSAFARQALPNPLGITARLTGTTDIRAATDNVVDVIARLRSGAAITDDEARRFARLLPQPGDSQESAARKIANVRAELESFASPGAASMSLEDALMSQGGYR